MHRVDRLNLGRPTVLLCRSCFLLGLVEKGKGAKPLVLIKRVIPSIPGKRNKKKYTSYTICQLDPKQIALPANIASLRADQNRQGVKIFVIQDRHRVRVHRGDLVFFENRSCHIPLIIGFTSLT